MNAASEHPQRIGFDGFWATAPDAPERQAEEASAARRGLRLTECKPIIGALLGFALAPKREP
jgi:hypothetical protein